MKLLVEIQHLEALTQVCMTLMFSFDFHFSQAMQDATGIDSLFGLAALS